MSDEGTVSPFLARRIFERNIVRDRAAAGEARLAVENPVAFRARNYGPIAFALLVGDRLALHRLKPRAELVRIDDAGVAPIDDELRPSVRRGEDAAVVVCGRGLHFPPRGNVRRRAEAVVMIAPPAFGADTRGKKDGPADKGQRTRDEDDVSQTFHGGSVM